MIIIFKKHKILINIELRYEKNLFSFGTNFTHGMKKAFDIKGNIFVNLSNMNKQEIFKKYSI